MLMTTKQNTFNFKWMFNIFSLSTFSARHYIIKTGTYKIFKKELIRYQTNNNSYYKSISLKKNIYLIFK